MKSQNEFKKQITTKIVETIQKGNLEKYISSFKRYGIPVNGISKKSYKGGNFLNLSLTAFEENYPSNEWFTFLQAKELDGRILKGEEGTKIIFWNFDDKNKSEGNERKAPIIKISTVFNRAQTTLETEERKPYQSDEKGLENENEIKEFILNIPHELHTAEGRAFFKKDDNSVNLPGMEDFLGLAHYYATYFHELTHLTGTAINLNRECYTRYHEDVKYRAQEELIAELGAAFLCGQFNIEGKLQHSEYIASWLKVLGDNTDLIFDASIQASKATDFLNKFTEDKK